MRLGRAPLLAGIVAAVSLAGTFAAVASSAAAPTAAQSAATVVLAASAAPALPAGALRLGALPAQTSVHVDVTLNVRDQAGLTALLAGQADKTSPYFRHFLHGGQFGELFGPTLAQVAEVEAWLRASGLTPGRVDSDRLSIPVTAPAAAIERALGVSLVRYRLPAGRVAFANTAAPRIPAAVAPVVQGVIGLDDLALPQDMALVAPGPKAAAKTAAPAATPRKPAAAGPQPCTAASDQALAANAYTANQLAAHYGMTTLYGMGDLGQGAHVAVAELDPDLASDISTYESCYGISTAVNYFTVDPGLGTGAGESEAALDIETIAGLAPDATIDVYQAPNTSVTDLYDIINAVVGKDTDLVLNVSYGLCELDASASLLKAYQNIMSAANAKGISVLAAAGDSGSTGCYAAGGANKKALSVESPASANYVDAVGGTTMTGAGWGAKEVVWNGSKTGNSKVRGAGGGGISTECMPAYQLFHGKGEAPVPGVVSTYTKTTAACKSKTDPKGYLREVPDLSASADPNAGYVFYYDGSWDWLIGGTSASTALMSAEAALIDASPYCGTSGWSTGAAGLLPEGLYFRTAIDQFFIYFTNYATQEPFVLYDIRSGNNDFTPSGYTAGRYPAKKGAYDLASGLGVPLVATTSTYDAGMAVEMCFIYAPASAGNISTRFDSPNYARAGSTVTVTVRGTGFLPITGTDYAEVSRKVGQFYETPKYFAADCTSHTQCTVTLFGLPAGTYGIQIYPAGFNACTGCKALVQFQSVGAPHVSALSPAKGKAGTKVTITGKNFLGVTAVDFGGTAVTSFKVVSSTKIVVTVPSGSGKESVTVTAVGGTSNKITFTYT